MSCEHIHTCVNKYMGVEFVHISEDTCIRVYTHVQTHVSLTCMCVPLLCTCV